MPLVEGAEAKSLCVWVDASSTDLMMVQCTPEFTAWTGPSSLNEGLLSWVLPLDQSGFYEFFQRAHNYHVMRQSGHRGGVRETMVLTLKPPHLGMALEVEVEVLEISAGDPGRNEEPGSGRILGRVAFKNVRKARTKKKGGSKRARSGSATPLDQGGYMEGLMAAAAESNNNSRATTPRSVGSAAQIQL
ncbi:unnamed protein product [Polarella glacialis]|uniref:Uncharacterized protein n=1 Tax=Polarella glacialis TaxID=89957 RepID=A0A813HVE7_POLGL|nr:unnamed protein product [Polarella glacialis]